MKWYFKILALLAAVALLPLQYLLLERVYFSLESNLYSVVDERFRTAVEEEAMMRFGEADRATLMTVQSVLEARGSTLNTDTLAMLFALGLEEEGLQALSFRIIETCNDTTIFRTAEDFLSEPSTERMSFSSLTTHIIPVSSDLSKGIAAVITNPYKAILPSLNALIIFSVLIVLFVIYCLYKVIRTLNKATFINNLRKDHTYAMIHDMKTPLSSIMIIAEDFKENAAIASDPDTVEQLKILEEECNHLNRICEKVINVAKVDNKKLKFVYEKIDLEQFFSTVKSKLQTLYPPSGSGAKRENKKQKKISFSADLSQEKWLIADLMYLTEIVDNIIDNSIKYSKEEVSISVRSVKKGKITELRIRDNGIGFCADAPKRLLRKFERGENTVGISGHGIGLNYVYQLMKFFGGYIKIESKEGVFTEVFLGFPSHRQYEIQE